MTSERLKTRAAQVALLCIVLMAALSVQNFFAERAQDREASLATCRSELNSAKDVAGEAVDKAQDRIDEHQRLIDDKRAAGERMVREGLAALAAGDDATLARLSIEAPALNEQLELLQVDLAPLRAAKTTARAEESTAVETYDRATGLAKTDPNRFLDECKARD